MEPSNDQVLDNFLATVSKLNVLRNLSRSEIHRVIEAKDILTTIQKSHRRKKYKPFLHDVLRDSGPGAVLLCAIPLGQARVTEFKAGIRTNICRLIQANKSALDHPTICALSAVYQIPISVNNIPSSLPTSVSSEDEKQPVRRPRTSKTTDNANKTPYHETQSELITISNISSGNPSYTTGQEQRVIENASLQGIAEIFDEHMCNAIRRVTVDDDLRAAVTMVFPVWGGLVDCLMSLDIGEQDVEQLVIALFNAKVK